MTTPHILFVCKTCATVWKEGKPQGKSGGQKLLENLSQLHQNWEFREDFSLQEIDCMSACSHSCAVSFAAPGKYTYLFGDLPPENSADAVLKCAAQYYVKPDGLLPWSERPEPLKKGVIARIPPIQ
jgi:predicted metal-binding protein